MDDNISRADAIEAIEKHIRTAEEPYRLTGTDRILNHAFDVAASCVYNLPSATRPTGRWSRMRTVETNGCPEHWLKCSACGRYRIIKMGEAFPDWCENCGADMRGEKNG